MFSWFTGDSKDRGPAAQPGNYNFDEQFRQALAGARDQAIALGSTVVETEHLLLGLLSDPGFEAVHVLGELGLDVDQLRQYVLAAAPRRSANVPEDRILAYSGAAKRVLELSMAEARQTGSPDVTQRHLLAGVLRQERGIGAMALAKFGVALQALRTAAGASAARLGIRIDDASDRSIYEQIVAQVQEAAATGRAATGERLPSVRALADELDIAPGTVARAYAELERRGVVVTDGARGTRIAERPAAAPARLDDLAGLIRPAVVAAYHQGATAADLRAALDRAMSGIYPAEGGAAA